VRAALLLLCLAATGLAQEPDAAIAPAGRWPDPRGTPSGSFRSAATPLVNDVVEAWSVELPGRATHAPLLWDGLAYVVCERGNEGTLVAIDIYLGEIVAKKDLGKGSRPRPVVWNGNVILTAKEGAMLVALRRNRKSFKQVWKSVPGDYGEPVVWDGEIHVINGGTLEQHRVGVKRPRWSTGTGLRGRPAIRGDHVYVCGHKQASGYEPHVELSIHARKSGQLVSAAKVAWYHDRDQALPGPASTFEITVAGEQVLVQPPRPLAAVSGACSHAVLPLAGTRIGTVGLRNFDTLPALHKRGVIATSTESGELKWELLADKQVAPIASSKRHPHLLQRRTPVAVLGDVVYFGNWAADVRSGDVLWEIKGLQVDFTAVPADGLVLLVDRGRAVRAYRARQEGRG
jgi:hypothetical protein